MVDCFLLVVGNEKYRTVCELAILALCRIEDVLCSQPVLGGRGGGGSHFNKPLPLFYFDFTFRKTKIEKMKK